MERNITRRTLLHTTAAGLGLGLLPWARAALAQKASLTGVFWGGPYLDAIKAVAVRQDKADIKWELHSGGAAAIIPKIKATWPSSPYDFVGCGDPQYPSFITEGWPEPMTKEEMPNFKDIPDHLFYKNAQGQILNVPMAINAVFFGYRKDIAPFPLKKMEDLLDPRLKGKVCVRDAVQGMNSNMVPYALANGGSPTNLEPGWEFLKKLAKSGNIARFAKTETDFINSITSGEAVAGFSNLSNWGKIAEQFPCEFLIRDKKEAPGFQAGLFQEGIVILKSSARKKEAKEFLNFFVSAENNSTYNKVLNNVPVNAKSESTQLARTILFKSDADRERLTHPFDWKLLNEQRQESIQRFEKEIVPLAK
ncbi:MAG: extracellular solute-binding protein [Rhodospirillales bacterium]|nr:extracellular solute-binding protein [Rhodospirillales bacterium]